MAEDERRPDSGDDEGSESSDPPQQDSDRATDPREEESDTEGAETGAQPETGTGLGEDTGQSGESDESDESGFDRADTGQPDESDGSGFGREDTGQPDESDESGFDRADTGQPDESNEDTGQPDGSSSWREDAGQPDESNESDESSSWREDTGQPDESNESGFDRADTRQPDESGKPGGSGFGREESRTRQGEGPETGRASTGTGGRETQQPAGARQGAGTGRPAATRGDAGAGPPGGETARRQGNQTGGVTDVVTERIRQFHAVIVWPESLIAGIGAWLVGFLLTAVPLWWFDFGEETGESILDISIWVYIESVGGTINGETLAVTIGGTYSTLESNAFGLGAVLHGFVPMLVLIVAGYILAGRHIKAGTTERPLQSVLAGGSLAVWFTLTLFLAAVVSSSDAISVNLLETLVVTLLYTGVLASVGATVRSRTRLTSAWGLLTGIGAFVVGLLAWRFIDNPFENRPGVDGITDLEGLLEYTRLLTAFVSEHGVGADEILPTWFAAVVPLLFGGVLALAYRRRDPVVGFGEGARLGTTYALVVFVAVVANIGAQAQEYEEQGSGWSDGQIEFVNQLIALAPRNILFAGIVYPVVFAAIGGAIGATAYDLWQSSSEESRQQTGQSRPEPAGSVAGGSRQEQGRQTSQQYQQSTGPGQQPAGQQTPDRSGQRPPEGAGDGYRAGGQSPGRTDDQYRSGQQPSGRADDQYRSGQQSPGRTDDQYRSRQQPSGQADDQYRSGQQPSGRADDQYRSGQQSPGQADDQYRSGQQPSSRTDDEYRSGQQSPGRTDDQYRSGQQPSGQADDQYRSGQQSPGRTDDQYRSGQQSPGRTDDQYRSGQQSPGRTDDQYRSGQGRAEGSGDRYQSDRGRADRGGSVDDADRTEGRAESDASGEELSPGDIVGDELDENDTGGS